MKSRRVSLHKSLGKTSYFLFPLTLLAVLPMLFNVWLRDDRIIMYASFSAMVLLTLFYTCGIIWRKKKSVHQRFMVATLLVLLDLAVGRIAVNLLRLPGNWGNHLPFLLTEGILLTFIFRDKKRGQYFKPWVVVLACFLIYLAGAYYQTATYSPAPVNSKSMDIAKIENAEISAWTDLLAARPEAWMQEQGTGSVVVDGVSLYVCKKIPFTLFNRALDMCVKQPLTENALDKILAHFRSQGISQFYLQTTPVTHPPNVPEWLTQRGMRHVSSWHRIARGNEPLGDGMEISGNYLVEDVTPQTAGEWTQFMDDVYGMPTGPWLLELPGRPGWHHVVCREGGESSPPFHENQPRWHGLFPDRCPRARHYDRQFRSGLPALSPPA